MISISKQKQVKIYRLVAGAHIRLFIFVLRTDNHCYIHLQRTNEKPCIFVSI
jgi:hypothetical protein